MRSIDFVIILLIGALLIGLLSIVILSADIKANSNVIIEKTKSQYELRNIKQTISDLEFSIRERLPGMIEGLLEIAPEEDESRDKYSKKQWHRDKISYFTKKYSQIDEVPILYIANIEIGENRKGISIVNCVLIWNFKDDLGQRYHIEEDEVFIIKTNGNCSKIVKTYITPIVLTEKIESKEFWVRLKCAKNSLSKIKVEKLYDYYK